jgi:pimeloyl-ACP methyl ester carboxylesterase
MAHLCIALMADLGHDRYDVLGHSMGGEVGLQMAVLAPEQVRRLVLLNSAGLEDLQRGMRGTLPAWFLDGRVQKLPHPAAGLSVFRAWTERLLRQMRSTVSSFSTTRFRHRR